MVRAKFKVESKAPANTEGEVSKIKLLPVVDGSEENKKFFTATPSGQIEIGTINKAAADAFEIGKSYYVDFTPAA